MPSIQGHLSIFQRVPVKEISYPLDSSSSPRPSTPSSLESMASEFEKEDRNGLPKESVGCPTEPRSFASLSRQPTKITENSRTQSLEKSTSWLKPKSWSYRSQSDSNITSRLRTNNRYSVTGTRTMNIAKSKAIAASLALKARQEKYDKLVEDYSEALGPFTMEFYKDSLPNEMAFEEIYFQFLGPEQQEKEVKNRESRNRWHHTFQTEDLPKDDCSADAACRNSWMFDDTDKKLRYEYEKLAANFLATPKGSAFVRVPEDRLDLPRIALTGPLESPYSSGLFFFDSSLEDSPKAPAKIKLLTRMYQGTNRTIGSGSSISSEDVSPWDPQSSPLLQVVDACQEVFLGKGQRLREDRHSDHEDKQSERRERDIRRHTLRWAILDPLKKVVLQEERKQHRRIIFQAILRKIENEEITDEETQDNHSEVASATGSCPNHSSTGIHDHHPLEMAKKAWSSIVLRTQAFSQKPTFHGGLKLSDLPKRKDYEYKEFTTIVIRHFVTISEQLEEQLDFWESLDPRIGTITLTEEIRSLMKRLSYLVEEQENPADPWQ